MAWEGRGRSLRTDTTTGQDAWLAALAERYLENLRVPEVTRALRALSSAYVERRGRGTGTHVRGALDSTGKRAAFALYYAPLHFLGVTQVLRALGADRAAPKALVDLGCGTGVAGAAWALACGTSPRVTGIDVSRWALDEARWTYARLGVAGRVRHGAVERLPVLAPATSVVAAYLLNELADAARLRLERDLFAAADRGGHVLVVEPLSHHVAPWWPELAGRVGARGGREDEWRLAIDPPPTVELFGQAAGLTYREIRFRTLWI